MTSPSTDPFAGATGTAGPIEEQARAARDDVDLVAGRHATRSLSFGVDFRMRWRVYWSFNSLPELTRLSQPKRRRVVREVLERVGHRWLFWLSLLLAYGLYGAIGVWAAPFLFGNGGRLAWAWTAFLVVTGQLTWEQLMIRYGRPLIPEVLLALADVCPVCGYDLTDNVSGVCPECGTKVVAAR